MPRLPATATFFQGAMTLNNAGNPVGEKTIEERGRIKGEEGLENLAQGLDRLGVPGCR